MSTENTAGAGTASASTSTPPASTATAQTPAGQTPPAPPPPAGQTPPAPAAGEAAVIDSAPPEPDLATFEFAMPEGFKPNDEMLKEFRPIAKELGLKAAGAQKLVDIYCAAQSKAAAAAEENWKAQQAKWGGEVKADKEVGGQNFDTTKVEVSRFFGAVDKDGSIRKAIAEMGLGNHPALVRLAVRAAKFLGEDSSKGVNAQGSGEQSDEDILRKSYPSMFKD